MGLKMTLKQFMDKYPNQEVIGEASVCAPGAQLPQVDDDTLVESSCTLVNGVFVAMIPAMTRSEANESSWYRKMLRKGPAKNACRLTLRRGHALLTYFVAAYLAGKALKLTFTRMGGRLLDAGNLSVSMKTIEDMVAGALLIDDGDPLWLPIYQQIPGGPVGVRVEIEVLS